MSIIITDGKASFDRIRRMPDIEKLVAAFKDPAVVELMVNPDGSVYIETAAKGIERLLAAPTQQDVAAFLNGVIGSEGRWSGRLRMVTVRPFVSGADITCTREPSAADRSA